MNNKPGPDGGAELDIPAPPRGLKAAVYTMGILLVVGFIVVFSTIIYRTVNSPDKGQGSHRAAGEGYGTIETALPAGALIQETQLDGDRLIVRFSVDRETGIVVYDIKRGMQLGRISLTTE